MSQHKGKINTEEMIAIAFGLITAAAFIYVWTQGLPMETQQLSANIG